MTDPAAAPVGDAAVGDPDWHAHTSGSYNSYARSGAVCFTLAG
jgi:hypothetical protein